MANQNLTSEVRDILERSNITGNILALPPGQLDRKLYESVNKALVMAGGRWKTGKGHVFDGCPRAKLGLMLETGVAVDEKKKFQAFYTPPELARRVALLASVDGKEVLEPSAGGGALVQACLDSGATQVQCIEINQECLPTLHNLDPDRVRNYIGDFMEKEVFRKFDRVVMNPPFTKNQDVKHVGRALLWLKPGSRLVAIMAPNRERKCFQDLIDDNSDHSIEMVPAGTFKESGTNIETLILTINT